MYQASQNVDYNLHLLNRKKLGYRIPYQLLSEYAFDKMMIFQTNIDRCESLGPLKCNNTDMIYVKIDGQIFKREIVTGKIDIYKMKNISTLQEKFKIKQNQVKIKLSKDLKLVISRFRKNIWINLVDSGDCIQTINIKKKVQCQKISDDSKILIVELKGIIIAYDIVWGQIIKKFDTQSKLSFIIFKHDEEQVVFQTSQRKLDSQCLKTFQLISSIDLWMDGRKLVYKRIVNAQKEENKDIDPETSDYDKIFEKIGEYREKDDCNSDESLPTVIAYLGNNQKLIYGKVNGSVEIIDLLSLETRRFDEKHSNTVNQISVSPDSSYALTVCQNHEIRIWDVNLIICMRVLKTTPNQEFHDVIFTKESNSYIQVTKFDVRLCDTVSGTILKVFFHPITLNLTTQIRRNVCLKFCISNDERNLVILLENGYIEVFNLLK